MASASVLETMKNVGQPSMLPTHNVNVDGVAARGLPVSFTPPGQLLAPVEFSGEATIRKSEVRPDRARFLDLYVLAREQRSRIAQNPIWDQERCYQKLRRALAPGITNRLTSSTVSDTCCRTLQRLMARLFCASAPLYYANRRHHTYHRLMYRQPGW